MNLKKKTGRSAVVLVDEYDKPLLSNISDRKMEEKNRRTFRSFFSTLKDADDYTHFVFITGVTKFSKVSIFSDLNQLKDISLLPKYADICGITSEELVNDLNGSVEDMAEASDMTIDETYNKLAAMYDGYHFSFKGPGVYNSFSLFNALSDQLFKRYWFESGTPAYIFEKLSESGALVQEFNDGFEVNDARISNYMADENDLVPLYYQSGYLTIKGYDDVFNTYKLAFPNDEVKYGFLEALLPKTRRSVSSDNGFSIQALLKYLHDGDADSVMKALKALLSGIPYHEGRAPEDEQEWRNIIYAVFAILGQYVRAEIHSANGRSDCIVENRDYIYIFELKEDKTADEALQQIDDNNYAGPYMMSGKKIIKIGASFSGKERTLSSWKIA